MTKYMFLVPMLTGCIIVESDKSNDDFDSGYDENGDDGGDEWSDWEDTPETDTGSTNTEDSGSTDINGTYYTVPSSGAPGDVFLSALRSDDPIDWTQIVNITPYGGLSICEFTPLFDELLLTIKIDDDAAEGTVDLVIEYANGDVDLVEDGFVIDLEADVGSAETDPNACE